MLEAAGQPYRVNPRLVRGMDYYNRTVFEWVTDHLGAQGTICGGGRYDGLIAQMGGKPAPAIGFGLGVERLLLLLEGLGLQGPSQAPAAYCVVASDAAMGAAVPLVEALREQGVDVVMHSGGGSMKGQFKKADASGARYALILGDEEIAQGTVTVKSLRDGGGAQVQKLLAGASGWAKELQS
jgi:histidyl-tRNA synthetase